MSVSIQNVKHSVIQRTQFKYTALEHPDWTMYLVIEGSFWCELNGKREIAMQGDLYFIPPGVPFRRSVIDGLKVHFFRFEVGEEDALFPIPQGLVRLKDEMRLQSTLQILRRLNKLSLPMQEGLLQHLLWDLICQCGYERSSDEDGAAIDPLVREVIAYFRASYREKISMREVAERFRISPSGLILKFKRATDLLPMRHLIEIRIKHAKRLLVDTSLSFAEIAERTGFENRYYFSNAFKREVGISPSEYQKRYLI